MAEAPGPLADTKADAPETEESKTSRQITISKEEYDKLLKAASCSDAQPPNKRSRSVESPQWDSFLEALAAKDLELMDLDPQLQEKLRTDAQARADFLNLSLATPNVNYFNPETGAMEAMDLTKKRLFEEISADPTLDGSEEKIREAMLCYHQQTMLPNLNQLVQACQSFYQHTTHELYYNQLKQDIVDTRLRALEAQQHAKCCLLRGLPAHGYNRTQLENNLWKFFQKAQIEWDCLASMTTHVFSSTASIMRVEFTTDMKRNVFFNFMRQNRNHWYLNGEDHGRVRIETDINTDDRLSVQPYYTMLDIWGSILPSDMIGPNGELQADRNSLQIWPGKAASSQQLLSQVAYVLDMRFARRYVCIIFVETQYFDEVQAKWAPAFEKRMNETLLLVQALSRAATDRTTTARYRFDKAFDISTLKFPSQQFPYPIIFMKMSSNLANLLSAHPSLPLQGSTGLLSIVQQVFVKYNVNPDDFGKGSKGKSKLSKGDSKGKGSSKGKSKPKGKAADRSPDLTNYGPKRDDNNDSAGPSRK